MEREDGVSGAVRAFLKHYPCSKTQAKSKQESSTETSSLFSISRCFGCSWVLKKYSSSLYTGQLNNLQGGMVTCLRHWLCCQYLPMNPLRWILIPASKFVIIGFYPTQWIINICELHKGNYLFFPLLIYYYYYYFYRILLAMALIFIWTPIVFYFVEDEINIYIVMLSDALVLIKGNMNV